MTEEGLKTQSKIEYTTKFKEINWTSDVLKELPTRLIADKNRVYGEVKASERLPGSETPITVSQAFLSKAQHYSK